MKKILLLFLASMLLCMGAGAQIPVEILGGDKRATLDILFFRVIKNKAQQNTKWLFFNRNRASVDYKQTTTSNLPQFGFTEAVSWNHPKGKGFAPVAVVQILNRGVFPKAGMQYAHNKKDFLFFSWVVVETLRQPNTDWFVLTRYTPALGTRWKLFTQLELLNVFAGSASANYNFIQRVRLGLQCDAWQFGAGGDFTATGRSSFTKTTNMGLFLRHEF
jgi:hypothetical protein